MTPSPDTRPLRLALVTSALGFGGTERGMVTLARAIDPKSVEVRVVSVLSGGPLADELRAAGFDVNVADGQLNVLTEALRGVDVALVSRGGGSDPIIPAACREAGVRSWVEWSIFGNVDRSSDERSFAAHLFISKMCWLRYREAVNGGVDFDHRHRVLYLPLDFDELDRLAPSREQACRELGLDPSRPVVSRVGRAADLKWRELLVDMVPRLLQLVPEAQVVFVGATDRKRKRLAELGVLDRCMLIEPSADRQRLVTFIAASDVTINASMIGESQGLSIAESLALGVPVVTCSTPWVDNAQIEFVEHGATGLIANHPNPFAEAVAVLLKNPEQRRLLGERGRKMVRRELDPARSARQVQRLAESLLDGRGVPEDWSPSTAECITFEAEYRRRLGASQRPLTKRESIESSLTRARERIERFYSVVGAVVAPFVGRFSRSKMSDPTLLGAQGSGLGDGSISGCVIVRNEEAVIERCLESLADIVDELIVIHDGPCSDRTLEVAEAHGAVVVVAEDLGNPEAHTVTAYQLARGQWLLNIDADEFLSPQMKAAIPNLVLDDSVNGYEFFWPLWNGTRYISSSGPYKLALSRRSATHLLGMLQSVERVDAPVERLSLQLEHRPRYNNFTLGSMRSKWDRWARIHAGELLGPYDAIAKFNWDGSQAWPWYHRMGLSLSPLLVVAMPPLMFFKFMWASRNQMSLRDNARTSILLCAYIGLLHYHVAAGRYRSHGR